MSRFLPNSPYGERVEGRLRDEIVGWLTTVSRDGTPRPSPVWFLWDGESILIYSRDGTARTRNLARSAACAFNFDSDGTGGDIVVLEGTAAVSNDPPSTEVEAYQSKYREHIARIGHDPDSFAEAYPVPIRFTPRRLRGF